MAQFRAALCVVRNLNLGLMMILHTLAENQLKCNTFWLKYDFDSMRR